MSPCERYTTADISFTGVAGEPVRRTFTVAPDVPPEQFVVTPMTIVRGYRGVDGPVVYLIKADVFPSLQAGRAYLVFGSSNFGNARDLITPGAIPTPIEEAAEEIRFLDDAVARTHGTIYGTLMAGREDDDSAPRTPIVGVTIRFSSEGFNTEAVTGADGRFAATGIPAGRTHVEPLLSDGWIGANRLVDVPAGGCSPLYLLAESNGRIRGRVVRPDGKPWTGFVDVVRADSRPMAARRRFVVANERGEFSFAGLGPGDYLVGVNLARAPSPGAHAYPPTFYPGTTSRDEATVVTVGNGTVKDGVDLVLPARLREGQVDVLVEANRGAVSVCVMPDGGGGGGIYTPMADGTIKVGVVEGVRYRMVAHVDRPEGDIESQIVGVTGTAGRKVVTLRAVLPAKQPVDPCWSLYPR